MLCAGILGQSKRARNPVGTELSYWPASQCSLAGRYDNPIPPRCLAPIDSLKIPAQYDNPIPIRFLAPIDCSKIPAQYFVYAPYS